jgi:hypothetical protein
MTLGGFAWWQAFFLEDESSGLKGRLEVREVGMLNSWWLCGCAPGSEA